MAAIAGIVDFTHGVNAVIDLERIGSGLGFHPHDNGISWSESNVALAFYSDPVAKSRNSKDSLTGSGYCEDIGVIARPSRVLANSGRTSQQSRRTPDVFSGSGRIRTVEFPSGTGKVDGG